VCVRVFFTTVRTSLSVSASAGLYFDVFFFVTLPNLNKEETTTLLKETETFML
jgi:hypothetical protein